MRTYGIAQSVRRGDQNMPAIVSDNGEGWYIGIDDIVPMQLYHKAGSLSVSIVGQGRGDDIGDYRNLYNNVMVVFMDQKKLEMSADDVFLHLQAHFPESLDIKPFHQVNLRITSVILITQAVFAQEYTNQDFSLKPEHNMFAVNYTIEAIFNKNCFEACPEC